MWQNHSTAQHMLLGHVTRRRRTPSSACADQQRAQVVWPADTQKSQQSKDETALAKVRLLMYLYFRTPRERSRKTLPGQLAVEVQILHEALTVEWALRVGRQHLLQGVACVQEGESAWTTGDISSSRRHSMVAHISTLCACSRCDSCNLGLHLHPK